MIMKERMIEARSEMEGEEFPDTINSMLELASANWNRAMRHCPSREMVQMDDIVYWWMVD